MANNDWLNHPALSKMEPAKKEIMQQLIQSSRGKSMPQMIPLLQAATAKMKQQNLSFSKEENALIMELISQSMSPAEKKQFEKIKKMLFQSH